MGNNWHLKKLWKKHIFLHYTSLIIRTVCALFLSWWRHQMETFSALRALCAGNSPVTGDSPHKGQWRGALMFSLICACINGWVNNREVGDLRCHRVHYDVIVMLSWGLNQHPLWLTQHKQQLMEFHPHLFALIQSFVVQWTTNKQSIIDDKRNGIWMLQNNKIIYDY